MPPPDPELTAAARAVLRAHDAGSFTRPAATQYPHQWNWDSAFNSLGWSHIDWARACAEIESMLAGRWRNGMVPHIRYDPAAPAGYLPGPDWWPRMAEEVAVPGQSTSGLTNPPVLVTAVRLVGDRHSDRSQALAFWRRVLPALTAYVRYFIDHRRLPGSPLFVVVHPWEGGWDNSPRWDGLRDAGLRPSRPYRRLDQVQVSASERPLDRDYDAYLGLVELWDGCGYDVAEFVPRSPFAVYDVLLDATWCRAARDLNFMAAALGAPQPVAAAELEEVEAAIEDRHWDPMSSLYLDLEVRSGQPIRTATPAGLAALAGAGSAERARLSWRTYDNLSAGALPVPTVPPGDRAFDRARYWRGPIWINVNWLIAEGLDRHGLRKEANRLRESTLSLLRRSGMAEYFDPLDGSGHGAQPFSWTAALTLEMLVEKGKSA